MTAIEIKAEIFDILAQQEQLRYNIEHLEQLKKQKLQELQEVINGKTSESTEQ